jgi:hypothetical protein
MLQSRGYTDKEVEGIMRSKWTRWAADYSDKPHGQATADDLAAFLDRAIRAGKRGEKPWKN